MSDEIDRQFVGWIGIASVSAAVGFGFGVGWGLLFFGVVCISAYLRDPVKSYLEKRKINPKDPFNS